MSCGIVICSKCKREVHQGDKDKFPPRGWYHCVGTRWAADGPICDGGVASWPAHESDIVRPYCGVDGMGGLR